MYDTHEVKDPKQLPDWHRLAGEMRDAAGQLNARDPRQRQSRRHGRSQPPGQQLQSLPQDFRPDGVSGLPLACIRVRFT